MRNVARVLALPLQTILDALWRPALASGGLATAIVLLATFVGDADNAPAWGRFAWLGVESVMGLSVYVAAMLALESETVFELRDALLSFTRKGSRKRMRVTAGPTGEEQTDTNDDVADPTVTLEDSGLVQASPRVRPEQDEAG